MALLEGKTPTERNKLIAAAGLGVVALVALYLAFGRSFFGGSTAAKPSASPTPTPRTAVSSTSPSMPSVTEQDFVYQTTPVVYSGNTYAPDPGRNIFAFYEPPKPCTGPGCPSPTPKPVIVPTPTPEPTPPIMLTNISPQAVYAGSRGFRLEVNGQRVPADVRIYFNGAQMPTTFINEQRAVTDIPANLIAQEGPRQIILRNPDGKLYSNPMMMNVQAPPVPQFQYVGAILRARSNNDTAIFERQGKPGNFSHRLNDVIDDRFRLVSIARSEVVLEDTQLGFRHRVALSKPQPGAGGGQGQPNKGGFPDAGFVPYDPSQQKGDIPGIPPNVPRYVPPPSSQPAPQSARPEAKKDVDDDDNN
jgi:hypothetical protein